jgi:hypothetical protein
MFGVSEETTYFALCYPFSYKNCLEKFEQIEHKLKESKDIYFHKELLIESIGIFAYYLELLNMK